MKIIKSTNNSLIKDIVKLKEKKYRDEMDMFLIEGPHLVEMAYKSNSLEMVFISESVLEKYKKYVDKISVVIVTDAIIGKLSFSKTPQGLVGVARKKINNKINGNKIIILDNLQDPGNVGTLFRSALAFNYDQVIVSNDSVDIYNDKLIRASQGAIFSLNIFKGDLKDIYKELNKKDYQIIATSLKEDSTYLKNLKVKDKYALILGNEGKGISTLSYKNATEVVKIEMSDKIDSLNVGVAGSIIMYKLSIDK